MKIVDGHAMIARVKDLYQRNQVELSYLLIVTEAVQMQQEMTLDELEEIVADALGDE